jgi:hypothetical protein
MRSTVSPAMGLTPVSNSNSSTPKRVDIHLLGDVLAGHLLGRHVIRRAQHVAGAVMARPSVLAMPKSINFTTPAWVDVDVLGLDVAVE